MAIESVLPAPPQPQRGRRTQRQTGDMAEDRPISMPSDTRARIVADQQRLNELSLADREQFRRFAPYGHQPVGNRRGCRDLRGVEIIGPAERTGQALAEPTLKPKWGERQCIERGNEVRFGGGIDDVGSIGQTFRPGGQSRGCVEKIGLLHGSYIVPRPKSCDCVSNRHSLRCVMGGMAKRPLKVFRTSAGFQDAFVAVTSRKAALEAWGARSDLFASGIAEQVTDPVLTRAALAQPGRVIRTPRGTSAEHLAAAGKVKIAPSARGKRPPARNLKEATPPPDHKPKASRAKLSKIEEGIAKIDDIFARRLSDIDARIDALRKEREQVREERDRARSRLEDRRDREEKAYRAAMTRWEG